MSAVEVHGVDGSVAVERNGLVMTLVGVRPRTGWSYSDGRPLPRIQTPDGPSMVFVAPDGEGIWDHVRNRKVRPWSLWKPLVAQLLDGMEYRNSGIVWRSRTYCECGCSPGFVVQGRTGDDIIASVRLAERGK